MNKTEEFPKTCGDRPIELCGMTWLIQPEGKVMRMKLNILLKSKAKLFIKHFHFLLNVNTISIKQENFLLKSIIIFNIFT